MNKKEKIILVQKALELKEAYLESEGLFVNSYILAKKCLHEGDKVSAKYFFKNAKFWFRIYKEDMHKFFNFTEIMDMLKVSIKDYAVTSKEIEALRLKNSCLIYKNDKYSYKCMCKKINVELIMFNIFNKLLKRGK